MMKRIYLSTITSVLFLLMTFLGLFSCHEHPKNIVPSDAYATYITAYTGGIVSRSSTVRVELTQPLPVVDRNVEVSNAFRFIPSLKGKAYWIDNKTIEFVPEENSLKPGTLYTASFQLGDYITVSENELKTFDFSFRVVESNFMIEIEPINVLSEDSELISVNGILRFSDIIERQKAEEMLTVATSDKQSVSIVLEGDENENRDAYPFTLTNIKKGEKDITLRIEIDGKKAGIDKKVTEQMSIPAKENFFYLSSKRIDQPENGIQLTFSELLDKGQDLKGLVSISSLSNYVFQVNNNKLNVYFETPKSDTLTVNIHQGIKNNNGKALAIDHSVSFGEQNIKPQVQILSTGAIMPDSKNLIVPFKAVNLCAVDLRVIRIFENNIGMFLQNNNLSDSNELRRSGRLVYKKRLPLDTDPTIDIHQWQEYKVDLTELIKQEQGAIYRIELSFGQDYSVYPCGNNRSGGNTGESVHLLTSVGLDHITEEDVAVWDIPNTWYNSYYSNMDWSLYDWQQTNNPCHPSYYMTGDKTVSCNVLATNLGLIVKRNKGNKIWVTVTDILTTKPITQADVIVYNFQLQPISSMKTDASGFAYVETKEKPFLIVASFGKQKTYLKVADGEEKSTTRFDVGGKELQKGMKGFIYGERGVWRPGDTLHVSFILEDHEKKIPTSHPVSFEIYNPQGQFYSKTISTNGINGFYTFEVPTCSSDPTGLWNGYVKVGGTSFHKSFRIETVKPNRLKINLQVPNDYIDAQKGNISLSLSSAWLTGATASNLKTKMEMTLTKTTTQFPSYRQYIFNNPAMEFSSSKTDIFDGVLDEKGKASILLKVPEAKNAPGMLRANITTRVFESGGDVSINTLSVPFSPFSSYVGINLNQPKEQYIETDRDHIFDVVTVDGEGKPVNRSNLEYKIYRVDWSWWWENRNNSFESYINNTSIQPVASGILQTNGGKGQFKFRVDYPSWGRYLVYVKDKDSGHATGGTIYVDWPDWRGRSNKSDPSGITMLTFSVDKESYEQGETVTVIIPAAANGRALVALEDGVSVIKRDWVEVSSEGDTKYQFKVTPEMAPNIYVHISLLQPHGQTVNDLPIRMYGVVPVFVTNKESMLEPVIKMPDVLRPEKEFSVTVSEKQGKEMTYTLAIVDDGLLDLTNYKTPDAWSEFYAREALGIQTWDIFDDVMGAYSGSYSSLFSVGGDEMLNTNDAKANRFRPIVQFLGPFTIEQGKSQTHAITLPPYVGSVRTMVVAGDANAYGNAEKTVPVRAPLMLLPTLPRVLSVGEEILLPINVFALEKTVKDVIVTVETSDNLTFTEGEKQVIHFEEIGDQMAYFRMHVGMHVGKETIRIHASSGNEKATETIEIDVRNPNPAITQHESKLLGTGEIAKMNYHISNNMTDSWVKLEVSRIPSVDISRRFDFLYNYSHSCTEQMVSRALSFLYIPQFKDLDEQEGENIRKHIQETIKNLYGRQIPNGGFVYWPGNPEVNEWITSYVGHFLLTAQEKGYEVNANVLNRWKAFQRRAAQNWAPLDRNSSWNYWQSDLQQAYRLYTLSLANAPELGAMNRMKEMKELSLQAKWELASAYALNGKKDAANELIFNAQTTIEDYSSSNNVYGSSDRDEALILESLVLLDRKMEAFKQAQKVSGNLLHETYFNTQSTAFSLMAMGRFAETLSGSIDIELTWNGTKQPEVKSAKALWQKDILLTPEEGTVSVSNKSNGSLYVDLITRTQLIDDNLPVVSKNLRIDVKYLNAKGDVTSISRLRQGVDLTAQITVTNTSGHDDYTNLALTHIIPSGWEVINTAYMSAPGEAITKDKEDKKVDNSYTYQDIRDDRVLTYFDLKRNQSKTFTIRLQTTYAGTFILPAIQCEAMYDTAVQARTKAGRITIER